METTTQIISDERRLDMLVGAMEGGSNYWYWFRTRAMNMVGFVAPADKQTPTCDRIFRALKLGLELPVCDIETGKRIGTLSMKSIEEGEMLMLKNNPTDFADIISGNDDACTADVWFQFAVLKELVYG